MKLKHTTLLLAVIAGFTLSTAALRAQSPGGCGACCPSGAAANAAAPSAKAKPYPLNTCLVSGEKLGEMGAPYVFVEQGQEIKLCCKNCLKDFRKEPAKYLGKLAKPKA